MVRAWLLLAFAIALHVTDEALTGFLPIYNDTVRSLRAAAPWIPLPVFTFSLWLTGLTAGVLLMVAVTPAIRKGSAWTRPAAWILAIIMIGNAVGHTAGSLLGHTTANVYFDRPMPGFWSSPFLFAASVWLLNQLRISGRLR
jgi:hypothetical protein